MSEEKEKQPETQKSETESETLEKALEEERKRSEEYFTRMKYLQADLENLKRRTEHQIEEVKRYCNESLIIGLLDVADELELAVKSGKSSDSADILVQGVEMTLRKLEKLLRNEGVTPIEALGKPFNPSEHNAVAKIEKSDVNDCTVIEEVRRGYKLREKVIRPSIVKISVKPSEQKVKGEGK